MKLLTFVRSIRYILQMAKKRVLLLVHPNLVPPEKATKKELESAEWKTEFYVADAIRKKNHELVCLGVENDLSKISNTIKEFSPHVAFNLLEEFDGEALWDQNVVSFLELKRQAYTGCSPRGLMIARDKALSKKILNYHRIPCPKFQVFPRNRKIKLKKEIKFPLIVKSLFEEASLGISQASVVHSPEALEERVQFVHESLETDAIAESYIEGREIYMAILGNQRIEIFSPWEMTFGTFSDTLNPIATARVKHNPDYRKKHGITTDKAKGLDEDLINRLERICRRTHKALYLSGYVRIDFRIDDNNTPYILEANPNPEIADYEDFAMAAYNGGYEYEDLIEKIINLGISRPGGYT